MATKIITISINDETEDILSRIKDRGMGASKFVREAAKSYFENGYQFIAPDNGVGSEADIDSDQAV